MEAYFCHDWRMRSSFPATLALALLVGGGCGGSVNGNPDGGVDAGSPRDGGATKDTGADTGADVDNGTPSETYPFPHPALPQIQNLGGGVMTAPKLVPILFASDGYRVQLEAYLQQLVASSYLVQVTSEYGAGPAKIAPPIELVGTPPLTADDFDTQALLATNIGKNGWPAADANTLFMVFYPQQTKVTYPKLGQACVDFWSYHLEMPLDGGGKAAYAVEPRCGKLLGMTGFDVLSARAAHDLVNAMVDPFPLSSPAWNVTDDDHIVWSASPGGQPASMCAWQRDNYTRIVGNSMVQRVWSNLAAAQSHDPCVPAGTGAYFAAAPVLPDTVTFTWGGWGSRATKGIRIPVGQKKTIDVVLFSGGPTDAFAVQAQDVDQVIDPMSTPKLDFEWDRTSGKNGEKLHLTISALSAGKYGGSELVLWATSGSVTHAWWAFVAN